MRFFTNTLPPPSSPPTLLPLPSQATLNNESLDVENDVRSCEKKLPRKSNITWSWRALLSMRCATEEMFWANVGLIGEKLKHWKSAITWPFIHGEYLCLEGKWKPQLLSFYFSVSASTIYFASHFPFSQSGRVCTALCLTVSQKIIRGAYWWMFSVSTGLVLLTF